MKFQTGDKVKFLNTSGGGIVSKIISPTLVNVMIEDGFEIPTLTSELVKVEPQGKAERMFDEDFPVGNQRSAVGSHQSAVGGQQSASRPRTQETKLRNPRSRNARRPWAITPSSRKTPPASTWLLCPMTRSGW